MLSKSEMRFLWKELTGEEDVEHRVQDLGDSISWARTRPPTGSERVHISMADIAKKDKHWVVQITSEGAAYTHVWDPRFSTPEANRWCRTAASEGLSNFYVKQAGQQLSGWTCGYITLYWALATWHSDRGKGADITRMPTPPAQWTQMIQQVLHRGATTRDDSATLPAAIQPPTVWGKGVNIAHRMELDTEDERHPGLEETSRNVINSLNETDKIGLMIAPSHIAGLPAGQNYGLFARKAFPSHRSLGSYSGILIETQRELEHKYRSTNGETEYVYERADGSYIDASNPADASMARWINHSKTTPNVEVVELKNRTLRVRTIRPIKMGEEILSNYSPND